MKKIMLEKSVVDEILRLYNDEMLGSPSISEKLNIPDKPQMVDPEMQEAVDEVDAPSPLLVWNGHI